MNLNLTVKNYPYTDDELSMIKDRLSKFIMDHNSPEVRDKIETDIKNTLSDIISNRRDIKIDEILNGSTIFTR